MPDNQLTPAESLQLIDSMINKAQQRFSENGFLYLLWGWVILFCSIGHFLLLQFQWLKEPETIWATCWLAVLFQIIYLSKNKKKEKVKTYSNEIIDYIWVSFGISMCIISIQFGRDNDWPHLYPLILMLYGSPTFLSGIVMQFKALKRGGMICWTLAIIAVFIPTKYTLLLLAIAVISAWIIPGYLLRKKYKLEKSFTMTETKMTEKESLALISQMINKAQNRYHDSGTGPILWGTVISICSLVTYFKIRYQFTLPFDIWYLTLVAIIPQIFIAVRENRINKAKGYDDDILDTVWMVFGVSIFLLIFINANIVQSLQPILEMYHSQNNPNANANFSSFATTFSCFLYGIPTIITATAEKMKPMLYGGIICWICCIISVFTNIEWDMLLTAIAAMAAWLVLGIIIRRQFKKSLEAHV
jgi:hypothetical protein